MSEGPDEYIGAVWAENENHAATQIQGLEPAMGVLGAVDGAMIQAGAQVATTEWGQAQAVQLEHGLETQSAPPFGGRNYAAYSTADLYDMVTTNMDPGAVGAAGATWHNLGEMYAAFAQSLGSAVSSSESGWTGTAADAARAFLTRMANWADIAGQGAQLAGNRTGMQAEAAQNARNSMPTPVEPPTADDVRQVLLQNTLNPAAGAAQIDQRFLAAQQAHDQAVRVVQSYDTNLAAVGDTMPAFATPPTLDPTGTNTSAANSPSPRPSQQTGRPAPANSMPGAHPTTPATTSESGPTPSHTATSPAMSLQSSPTDAPGTSPSAAGTLSGPNQLDGGPSSPNPLNGPDLFGAPLLRGGRAGGVAGIASGTGEPGALGEPVGSGTRSGVGPEVEEAAERPSSGLSGGTATAEGMPMSRAGQGAGDKKRYRPSYLKDPDPEKTFGTDQVVAPPVIGA